MFVNSIRQDGAGISTSPSWTRTGADNRLGRFNFPRIIRCAVWQRFLVQLTHYLRSLLLTSYLTLSSYCPESYLFLMFL